MLFFRQTLLAVCLIVCCAFSYAQAQAMADDLGEINEDSGPTAPFNILANDDPGAGFSLNAASVDLDVTTPGIYDESIHTTGGVLTYDLTNSVVFEPDPNYAGSVTVPYTVETDEPQTLSATITLNVLAVNDPPVITASITPQVILEDETSAALSFTVTDVEDDADDLDVSANAGSSVVIVDGFSFGGSGNNRTITVSPEANQNGGPIIVTVQVEDTEGATDDATFEVSVTPVNDAPTITSPGPQVIDEDASAQSFSFTVSDIDDDLDGLNISGSSNDEGIIANGQISFGGSVENRTVTVTPEADQNGPVIITLQVADAAENAQTTFNVNVNAVNDAPTFVTVPGNQAIDENSSTGPLSVVVNDIDSDPTTLTLSAVSSNESIIPNGNIDIQGNSPNPTIEVTSTSVSGGPVDIDMTVSDGIDSGTGSFTVSVSNIDAPPTIDPISDQSIDEDTSLDDLAFTIDDPDGLTGITISATSDNQLLIPDGQISIGGTLAAPTISLSPLADAFGTATITVVVDDGTSTSSTTFDVEVINVNDAPTITGPGPQTIPENTPTSALNFTVADIDNATASLTVTATSSDQLLIPNGNIAIGGGTGATRTVTVTPAANQSGGPVTITLTVSDGVLTGTTTFTVTIDDVNQPPTITGPGPQSVAEDGSTPALNFTVSDPDNPIASLTVTATSSNQAIISNGSIVIGGGTGATRTVTVSPEANQTGGPVTITLTVSDGDLTGTSTFAVTVTAVNDVPTITGPGPQSVPEDGSTGALNFTVADIDNVTASLTVTATSSDELLIPNGNISIGGGTGATRTVTVTPAPNQSGGPVTITLTVSDGTAGSSTSFDVTVIDENDAPTISSITSKTTNEDVQTAVIPFTVGDAETNPADLTVTASSDNTDLVINTAIVLGGSGPNRTVQITPVANQSGTVTITLTVSDGDLTTSTSFQLTVNSVNDAPTISAITDKEINEDTPSVEWPFTINDVETPGTLSVTASSGNTALITNPNVVLGGSGTDRTIKVTPSANQSGTSVITVNVSDGTNTTSTTFTVTVNSVNDLPTISVIADQEVAEDNPTAALAFTIGDTETAAGTLTVSATSDNTALVPVVAITFGGSGAARTVTVAPAANQYGQANITITVNDGTDNASTTFQLTVTAVNDAPVITSQTPVATDEEQPVDIELSHLVVTDPDNTYPDDFTLTILANPGYTFTDNTVTPNANVTGNITVRVQVSDGSLSSNIYNLQVAVTPVNDPPNITAQNPSPLTVSEDGSITVLLSHLTIVDPDNASGFTLALTDGANYSVSGSVVTPDPNYNGTLSVPVTVSDGTTSSAPFPLQIQVNPINDVPQITGQASITIAEVQPVAIELSQLTVFDPDNDYPDDFTIAILSGPNYSITGNTVVPVPNFSGTLLVRVFVNDGTANSAIYNLQISVNTTNDPPVITGQDPLNTDEGVAITIGLDNLTVEDPDNTYPDDFTLTILPGPNYTFSGNVVTPNADYEGVVSVGVKVNDGAVDSAPYSLQISINGINNAPVITGQQPVTTTEDQAVTLRLADLIVTDPDSPFPGAFTLTVLPGTNYTVSENTVIPTANYSGALSVPVTVNDGSLTSDAYNLQVTVTPVNDAPVINGQNALTTFEDVPIVLKLEDFQVTDVDNTYPTGFSLTAQPGSGATYTVSGTTVTPVSNFNGTLTVGVIVNDGGTNSNVFPVEIGVTAVNDAPTLNAISNVTIQEDPTDATTVSLAGITSGGGEASQVVTVTASHNTPEWFETFEIQYAGGSTGSLTLKPLPNKFGTATVTVRVQDNGAGDAPNVNFFERTFSFIVEPVNDPPSFVTTPLTLIEVGTEYSYLIEAADLEGEAITFGAPLVPAWLSLSQNANGKATLSGTPPPGTTGEVSVVIQVKDPAGTPVTNQEFTINVNARPVISSFPIATDEEIRFEFSTEFTSNFMDADADTLSEIEITLLPTKGTLLLKQVAVVMNQKIQSTDIKDLDYLPMIDSTGTDTFQWKASDGLFYSANEEEVIITIRAVNDPPEIIALELPANDTLKYELGSERPILLTRIFDAKDADGDDILAAEISFTVPQEYFSMEDMFLFNDTLGITGTFNETLGILTLTGRASVADYVAAIRSIRYNLVVAPIDSRAQVGINRNISIKLSDGVFGGTKERLIGLINTFLELDIATAFTPTGANPVWNIYSPNGLEQYKDALIKVYNKRGTLVYEAKGFGVPWNGDGFEGALPADSYFYTIDLKYDKKKYKGVVTILR